MAQLIDKTAVVAEIERLISNGQTKLKESEECNDYESYVALAERIATCINVLSFLDTIEAKEVDLAQEIKNRIDSLSNLYCYMEDLFNGNEEEGVYPIPENVKNELFEFAKYFFELGLKIKKGE